MCISSNHGKHSHNRKLLVSEKFIFCNDKSNYKKVKEKAMNFALVQDNDINKICVKVFPKHTIAFYPQSSKKKNRRYFPLQTCGVVHSYSLSFTVANGNNNQRQVKRTAPFNYEQLTSEDAIQ